MKDNQQDTVDEFKFKPLTEGLGFHDKEESSHSFVDVTHKDPLQDRGVHFAIADKDFIEEEEVPSTQASQVSFVSVPGFQSPKYKSDQNPISKNIDLSMNGKQEDDEGFNVKKYKEQDLSMDWQTVREEKKQEKVYLEEATPHVAAMLFDFFAVLAMVCGCLFILLTVTGVELSSVVQSAQIDIGIRMSVFVLIISVLLFYTTVSRSFFNSTLGEWTFDLQVGSERDFKSVWYPVKSFWRQFALIAMGGVFVPIFSWILRKDVAYWLTGLRLYKKHVKWES